MLEEVYRELKVKKLGAQWTNCKEKREVLTVTDSKEQMINLWKKRW